MCVIHKALTDGTSKHFQVNILKTISEDKGRPLWGYKKQHLPKWVTDWFRNLSFKIWDCKLLPWRTSSVDHCGVGMSHDWSGLRTPIRNSIAYLRYMAFRLTCCVFFQVWHLSEDSKGFDGADIYWSIHLHFQLPFHSIPLCLRAVIIPHSWDVRNLILSISQ